MSTNNTKNIKSPTEQTLISSNSQSGEPQECTEKIKLKKQLGLLEGCAIILGIIFGSGMYEDNA